MSSVCNPPFPDVPGTLRSVTSSSCGRYDEKSGALLSPFLISPGLFTSSRMPEPQYLPPHWSAHVHPEGQLYFYRHYPLRIVTEAHLYDSTVLDKILHWSAIIEALLAAKNVKISEEMELYLGIKDNNCTYYLVDYASKTQFWAENMSTDDLQLHGVLSPGHLRIYLESLFWKHVEHFPMHSGALAVKYIDELLSVFSHGLADKMTSVTSTFFYDKPACQDFVKLLKTSREHLDDGRQICLVARLWTAICDHRFSVHYGTQHCRLDRNKSVLWADPEQVPWVTRLFSTLSFGTYNTQLTRIHDLFCDRLLYLEQWRPYISANIQEWREVSGKAFAGILLHVFNLLVPSSPVLGVISFALFSASLLSAVSLLHRYKTMQDVSVSVAREHIVNIESAKFGFQFAAFTYCLPTTLWLHGIAFFFIHCLYLLGHLFGTKIIAAVTAFLLVAFFCFHQATSDCRISFALHRPSFFRRQQTNNDHMA